MVSRGESVRGGVVAGPKRGTGAAPAGPPARQPDVRARGGGEEVDDRGRDLPYVLDMRLELAAPAGFAQCHRDLVHGTGALGGGAALVKNSRSAAR